MGESTVTIFRGHEGCGARTAGIHRVSVVVGDNRSTVLAIQIWAFWNGWGGSSGMTTPQAKRYARLQTALRARRHLLLDLDQEGFSNTSEKSQRTTDVDMADIAPLLT